MRNFQLRNDLERVVIGGFALPLGIAPVDGNIDPPVQGYTVAYMPGEEDEPDTYSFHVVVSHERLASVINRAFDLLPEDVFGIIEIGSRDAYRSTDTYIGQDPIALDEFRDAWKLYEPFLLEDSSIAAGANSEDPFVEVFIDQWKGLSIHVPLSMREEVELLLREFDLEEVAQTWSGPDDQPVQNNDPSTGEFSQIRPVLDLTDETSPDVDELLLNLRHDWMLELNVDPSSNIDDGGRNLGSTLWHAVVIVDRVAGAGGAEPEPGGYASIWATASSLDEMEQMMETALEPYPEWTFGEMYTIDRVAFDERPDELADLMPNQRQSQIHLVTIEAWNDAPRNESDGSGGMPDRKSRKSAPDKDDR